MQVEERQAAVAYTYAWWMTGDEDAATAALRTALQAPDPADGSAQSRQTALVRAVRAALGDEQTMYPASQVALLHDGLEVDLEAAAEIAGVAEDEAPFALAHGRLEALLETVRGDFEHPDRLGGLAVGDERDVEHADDCPSCTRAHTLLERGRTELRAVAPVSAPPGLLAQLVAEAAPPAVDEPDVIDLTDAPAAAGPEAPPREDIVLPDVPAVPEAPEAPPAPPVEPTAPRRPRVAGVLAGAGVVTLCVLVAVLVAQGGEEAPAPAAQPPPDTAESTESPAVEPTPTEQFGPRADERNEFAVLDVGLLRSGETDIAPSGTTISADESIRIAVDYANATDGVQLDALWRVNDEPYERLETVVSGTSSRHVWGLPKPADGWPPGRHRVVLTANENVAGAVDFTVEPS